MQSARAGNIILPSAIAKKINSFRNLPDPEAKERLAKIEILIGKLEKFSLPSITEGGNKSDLMNTAELEFLKKYSRGIVSLTELHSLPISGGFSLGLSARSGIYEMLSERLELNPWTSAYPEFGIDWHKVKNHTEVFLARVQATDKPVVFFLPNKTISYPGKSVTVDELKWFLKSADRLKNVYFVFGAYDMITSELEAERNEAGLSSDEFRALFLRALGATTSSYDQVL